MRSIYVLILLLLFLITGCSSSDTPSSAEEDQFKSGTSVTIQATEGAKTVWVCPDREAFQEALKTVSASDKAGIRELYEARKVFDISVPTKALVLEHDLWTDGVEVRLLDGERREQKVWILSSKLKR